MVSVGAAGSSPIVGPTRLTAAWASRPQGRPHHLLPRPQRRTDAAPTPAEHSSYRRQCGLRIDPNHTRPADRLAGKQHLRGDLVEDGRADEAAVGAVGHREAPSVKRDASPLAAAALDGMEDPLSMLLIDDRSKGGRLVQTIAGLQ